MVYCMRLLTIPTERCRSQRGSSVTALVSRLLLLSMARATNVGKPLKVDPRPFNTADSRLADNNALAPRIECGLDRLHHFRWLSRFARYHRQDLGL